MKSSLKKERRKIYNFIEKESGVKLSSVVLFKLATKLKNYAEHSNLSEKENRKELFLFTSKRIRHLQGELIDYLDNKVINKLFEKFYINYRKELKESFKVIIK